MQKFAIATLFAMLAMPAAAADLAPKPMAVKAPATPTPVSGFYFGLDTTGAMVQSNAQWLALPGLVQGTNLAPSGLGVGATFGYRAWLGPVFIAPEIEGDYLFQRTSTSCGPLGVNTCSTKNTWGGAAVVKVGAPIATMTGQVAQLIPANLPLPAPLPVPASAWASALMPYIAGGVRARELNGCVSGLVNQGCSSTTIWGWTAGAGVIMPVAAQVNLDVSAMYDNYNQGFTPGSNVTPLLTSSWKSTHGVTGALELTIGF